MALANSVRSATALALPEAARSSPRTPSRRPHPSLLIKTNFRSAYPSISHLAGIPLGVFGVLYFMFWTLNLREFHRTGQDELVVNARDSDISEFKRLPLALSRRIDPRLYPTLVLIAPDGRVVFMDEGLSSYMGATPERFIAALDERMLADRPRWADHADH